MKLRHETGIVFLSSLLLYGLTLKSWVGGGDSGELAGAAMELGVAHPPGFPLYVLLGHFFSSLPILAPILWLNFFSALCGAGAIGLIYYGCRRLEIQRPLSVLAAMFLLISPVIWHYSTLAEVFALNNLFIAGLFVLWVRLHENPKDRVTLNIACLWLGLGLANHPIFLLFVIPFVVWLVRYTDRPNLLHWKNAICFLIGPVLYGQLLLTWEEPSYFVWGNTQNWSGFFHHVLRRDYGTFKLSAADGQAGSYLENLKFFSDQLVHHSFGVGAAAFLIGIFYLLRQRHWLMWWFGIFGFYLAVFVFGGNMDLNLPAHKLMLERFTQPLSIIVIIIGAWGINEQLKKVKPALHAVLLFFAAMVMAGSLIKGFKRERHDETRDFYNFAKLALTNIPQGSIIIMEGDHITNTFRYLRRVDRFRRDLILVDRLMLSQGWYLKHLHQFETDLVLPPEGSPNDAQLVMLNPAKSAFVANGYRGMPGSLRELYNVWPEGLVEHILPIGQMPEINSWWQFSSRLNEQIRTIGAIPYDLTRWNFMLPLTYWIGRAKLGLKLFDLLQEGRIPPDYRPYVAEILEEVVAQSPDPQPALYKFIGLNYHFMLEKDPSRRTVRDQAWQKYFADPASQNDPDLAQLKALHATNP